MKSASSVMYTIGRIFNIIELVFNVLGVIFGILIVAMRDELAKRADMPVKYQDPNALRALGVGMIVFCVIVLIISIVALILSGKARRSIRKDDMNQVPHIIMVVIGVIGNIFYLLGGIFGLIEVNNQLTYERFKNDNK